MTSLGRARASRGARWLSLGPPHEKPSSSLEDSADRGWAAPRMLS
jgi:hypothetical protein